MNVVVMRAGSWGATLAGVLAKNGHSVTLVAPHEALRRELIEFRENRRALPGVRIPDAVHIVATPDDAVDDAEAIVFPGPCDRMREMARDAVAYRSAGVSTWSNRLIITAAKGIAPNTLQRMSEVLGEELGCDANDIVALSGPSFARYVGLEHPTGVVAASANVDRAKAVQRIFGNAYFRVYRSSDTLGVELGGALKNVVAIAAGMCDGIGLGDNSRVALMTRGLAEITRLGVAMGADPQTFAGLSGMGDLVLTCSGRESRNHHVGEEIGRGRGLDDVLREMVTVAEGIRTTRSAVTLARTYGVEMPIAEHVYAVLFEGSRPKDAVTSLMVREPKPEQWV